MQATRSSKRAQPSAGCACAQPIGKCMYIYIYLLLCVLVRVQISIVNAIMALVQLGAEIMLSFS